MTLLEKKMDAVARCLLAENGEEKWQATEALRALMAQEARPEACQDQELEARISGVLLELGIPEKLNGHRSLVCALALAIREPELLNNLTAGLYTLVGETLGTSWSRVERAIRHAIEAAWSRGDVQVLERWFGNTVRPDKGRPTCGEFIARVAYVLRAEV